MVLLRSFEKINNFLHFSLGLMQTRHICEFHIDVLGDIELLLLRAHCLTTAHCALGSSDYGGYDEDYEEEIENVVQLVEDDFNACSSLVAVLDVPVLHYVIQNFIEGQHLAIEPFISNLAYDFLQPYLLVSEVLLLNKLYLLEGVHLHQIHESLRSQFSLLPQNLIHDVNSKQSHEDSGDSEFLIVDVLQLVHEVLNDYLELLDQLHWF